MCFFVSILDINGIANRASPFFWVTDPLNQFCKSYLSSLLYLVTQRVHGSTHFFLCVFSLRFESNFRFINRDYGQLDIIDYGQLPLSRFDEMVRATEKSSSCEISLSSLNWGRRVGFRDYWHGNDCSEQLDVKKNNNNFLVDLSSWPWMCFTFMISIIGHF